MTHQQSFIKQFTGADVYMSDLIAHLTHFCTDLTHFHLCSHSYQSYGVEVYAGLTQNIAFSLSLFTGVSTVMQVADGVNVFCTCMLQKCSSLVSM